MTPDRISPHILRQIGADEHDTDALLAEYAWSNHCLDARVQFLSGRILILEALLEDECEAHDKAVRWLHTLRDTALCLLWVVLLAAALALMLRLF